MNIKDLQPGSYQEVSSGTDTSQSPASSSGTLNINSLPKGSYQIVPPQQKNASAALSASQSILGLINQVGDVGIGAGKQAISALQNVGVPIAEGENQILNDLGIKTPYSAQGIPQQYLQDSNTQQKIGSVVADFGEFLAPAGDIEKASEGAGMVAKYASPIAKNVASMFAKKATETAGYSAIGTAQSGDIKQGIESGAFGSILGSIPLGKYLGSLLKNTGAFISGRSPEVIDQIFANPDAAKSGLKNDSVSTIKKGATQLIQSVRNISQKASEAYGKTLEEVENKYKGTGTGVRVYPKGRNAYTRSDETTIIPEKGNAFNLGTRSLKAALTNSLGKFGITGSIAGGYDFSNASFLPAEEGVIKKVAQKVQNWTDFTPTGINKLRQSVSNFARPASGSMEKTNTVIYHLASDIGDYLGERVPEIAEANKRFSQQQNFLGELSTHLGTIGKIDKYGQTDPTEMKNVSVKIASLFDKNKDLARSLIEKIPGGKDVMGEEAGRQMSSVEAKPNISGDISKIAQGLIPPKWIGEAAAAMGSTAEKIGPMLEKLTPATRQTFIQELLGGSSAEQNQ